MKTWEDVPGFFDFQDLYDEAVAAAPQNGAHFVELGVLFGRSAIYMATQICRAGKTITFDAVDSWHPSFLAPDESAPEPHRQYRAKMKNFADLHGGIYEAFQWSAKQCGVASLIRAIKADQIEVARRYPDRSVDFIFLDSDHSEEGTRAAINAWLPKVKPGGVFAGHDFVPRWSGVVAAVKALLPDAAIRGQSFFWRVAA